MPMAGGCRGRVVGKMDQYCAVEEEEEEELEDEDA